MSEAAQEDPEALEPSPTRTKSPNILKTFAKSLRRKSEPKETSPSIPTPPVPRPSTRGPKAPLPPQPLPKTGSTRSTHSFLANDPSTSPEFPPGSPYASYQASGPSRGSGSLPSTSLTGSFASLAPSTEEYRFELERLQIQYRTSQENLRLEREQADAQRMSYEAQLAAREARHREELEALRRAYETDNAKGKRRG
jgi:hypothetical protein